MEKIRQVTAERLEEYEKARVFGLQFQVEGNTVKSIKIETDIGPLKVRIDSYSVSVTEPIREKAHQVVVTDPAGVIPSFFKMFTSKDGVNGYVGTLPTGFKWEVSEIELSPGISAKDYQEGPDKVEIVSNDFDIPF